DVDVEDWEDMIEKVGAAHDDHFHHEPVAVPMHKNPFSNNNLQLFNATLAEVTRLQVVPGGYGIRQEEWEDGIYPASEIIKSGRKGSKELRVTLPDSIWRSRAQQWVRALAVLDHLMH
ncbi:hypothetical protein B0H17DRAFT_856711, partial [Mycena rosella]